MRDDLLFEILQLSKEDKLQLVYLIQSDLSYIEEGASFSSVGLSEENKKELVERISSSNESMCLIEFEDHVAHLKNKFQ